MAGRLLFQHKPASRWIDAAINGPYPATLGAAAPRTGHRFLRPLCCRTATSLPALNANYAGLLRWGRCGPERGPGLNRLEAWMADGAFWRLRPAIVLV